MSVVSWSLAKTRRQHLTLSLLLLFCCIISVSWVHSNDYDISSTFETFRVAPSQNPPESQPVPSTKSPPGTGSSSSPFANLLGYVKPGKEHTYHHGFPTATRAELSIKPIVYVFPQFYPIPENDKFWGVNFTEWVNVKKLTVNSWGTEIIRPAEEVGYYNLLDLSTRKRWTETMKKSRYGPANSITLLQQLTMSCLCAYRIHGIAYHHYWFGYPVMDGIFKALLEDGHPDMPFMLSWANEPWTVRWDGIDAAKGDGTLLAQDYGGLGDWRRHYDWMLPLFKHPNYIRVNGKVQMMIYSSGHMGDKGKQMLEAWRIWASEDPAIGGMDVIETKTGNDDPETRGQTDAVSEFAPRTGTSLDATTWPAIGRTHRIYHRGAMVAWDNTPRHANNGGGTTVAFSHPRLWKGEFSLRAFSQAKETQIPWHSNVPHRRGLTDSRLATLIEHFRRIKSDPNPLGEDNFFFINAFNEWGEGNALEPSVQWGDGFIRALDEAMDYADEQITWRPHLLEQNARFAKEVEDDTGEVDVCVIIRDFNPTRPWQEPWTLSQTLDSLRKMHNERWRGVVVNVHPAGNLHSLDITLLHHQDARIVSAAAPDDVLKEAGENKAAKVTDWVIEHLDTISPSCGRAKFMLITDATNRYEPDTFNGTDKWRGHIVGLNFESRESMDFASAAHAGNFSWDQRCDRFKDSTTQTCRAMAADAEILDLGAALIDMKRWRDESIQLFQPDSIHGGGAEILRKLAQSKESPWTWITPTADPSISCHLLHAGSLTTCIRSGRMWVDFPDNASLHSGCYSGMQLQMTYRGPKIPERYDYIRFKEDPSCVRLSQEAHVIFTS